MAYNKNKADAKKKNRLTKNKNVQRNGRPRPPVLLSALPLNPPAVEETQNSATPPSYNLCAHREIAIIDPFPGQSRPTS